MGRLALIDPWGWWRLGSGSGLLEEQRAGVTNMELGHPGGLLRGGNSHLPTVAEKSHPVNGRWGREGNGPGRRNKAGWGHVDKNISVPHHIPSPQHWETHLLSERCDPAAKEPMLSLTGPGGHLDKRLLFYDFSFLRCGFPSCSDSANRLLLWFWIPSNFCVFCLQQAEGKWGRSRRYWRGCNHCFKTLKGPSPCSACAIAEAHSSWRPEVKGT